MEGAQAFCALSMRSLDDQADMDEEGLGPPVPLIAKHCVGARLGKRLRRMRH